LKKYVCSVCGYVYDEAAGDPERGIAPGTKWEDVPDDWECPLCGAVKTDFSEQQISSKPIAQESSAAENEVESMRELSFGEVAALCSNLAKGCIKQYRSEEAELFNQIAEFYQKQSSAEGEGDLKDLSTLIEEDLASGYGRANSIASDASDRGALRALAWGKKVTKILNSLLGRYEKQQDALLDNTNVYVCEICGFVYIGDGKPEICPVCKVPNKKLVEIKG
jgi:rubredoxin